MDICLFLIKMMANRVASVDYSIDRRGFWFELPLFHVLSPCIPVSCVVCYKISSDSRLSLSHLRDTSLGALVVFV